MGQADGFGFGEGRPRLRRGLRVDHLGDERLVLDPVSGVVHTVRGPAVPVLDQILTGCSRGSRDADGEVLAALVASGIVEISGVTRRQALALSSSAFAFVVSASLPSAVAAASVVSLSNAGIRGTSATYSLADGSTVYRVWDMVDNTEASEFLLTLGSVAKSVEVVLVGAGGSGGEGSGTFYAGGGGGGEVAFVNLGTVPAGTQLRFTVAGTADQESGAESALEVVTGVDSSAAIMTATGGGRGATSGTGATSGGSGGGGSATHTSPGSSFKNSPTSGGGVTIGPGSDSYVNIGGAGNASFASAGGGGGSNGVGGAASDAGSGTGGDGGDGRSLLDITSWNAVGSSPNLALAQLILGAGGGGAGETAGGSSNAGPNSSGGGFYDGSSAKAGENGPLGSGCGGGGGLRSNSSRGSGGLGGSGVAWIRVA